MRSSFAINVPNSRSASHTHYPIGHQVPRRFYFAREVGVSDRSIIKQYELPARRYLGPTSMEAEMAFIMCNQARVRLSLLSRLFLKTANTWTTNLRGFNARLPRGAWFLILLWGQGLFCWRRPTVGPSPWVLTLTCV